MKKQTRREFLKKSILSSAGMMLNRADLRLLFNINANGSSSLLGRVFAGGAVSYSQPNEESEIVHRFVENDVLQLVEPVVLNSRGAARNLWYLLEDGSYLQSSAVQPAKNLYNAPNLEVGSSGRLAEVTVPFTEAINYNSRNKKPDQIFYFGTVHWVYGIGQNQKTRNYYYLVKEDRWGDLYYVDATHLRVIEEEELQPISPNVPLEEKTIRINLDEQYLLAYEYGEPVFISPMASGLLTGSVDLTTPRGSFIVNYKRPSRHMAHGERFGANGGELFGVPWVSYFTDTGIAFHGTYWHNDFTQPKSHGCINMPIPAAKWVYRWTYPVISPRQEKHVDRYGTAVEIL